MHRLTGILLVAVLFALAAFAQTETVIFDFPGGTTGSRPISGLTPGPFGELYGANYYGGTFDNGAVFQLTPPNVSNPVWEASAIYEFPNGNGGPTGGVLYSAGALYVTSGGGGGHGSEGAGTVVQLLPPSSPGGAWTSNTIYSFQGDELGRQPSGTLIAGPDGTLFGTTTFGGRVLKNNGENGNGCVFALRPPQDTDGVWTYRVLYRFKGGLSDGGIPNLGGLVFGRDGALYGATLYGGANNDGVVYRLAPPASAGDAWQESVIHSFDPTVEGILADAGLVVGSEGALYGETSLDGAGSSTYGSVFQLSPPASPGAGWAASVIYPFVYTNGTGGAGVTIGPGDTIYGASSTTIFTLTPPTALGGVWTPTILHTFTGTPDGSGPNGTLLLGLGGQIYGTTGGGGSARSLGTAFLLSPAEPSK